MANIAIKDGEGQAKYIKAQGAGTSTDPFVQHMRLSDGVNEAQITNDKELMTADARVLAKVVELVDKFTLSNFAFATPVVSGKLVSNPTAPNQLPDLAFVKGFTIKSSKDSAGSIYIGTDNTVVLGSGIEIAPGESVYFQSANSNLYWAIGDAVIDIYGN